MGRTRTGDELGQLLVARQGPSAITTEWRTAQNHPLYGLLAHCAIRALPLDELRAFRAPAMVAGVLVPIVFYRAMRRWVGHEAAILSAFALVVVDPIRHYASEGRGYTILVLGALVTAGWLLDFLESGRVRFLVGYVAAAAATGYAHLWAFPVLAAHGAFVILEALRPGAGRLAPKRAAAALGAIAAAIALGIALYRPMLPEILGAGRARVPGPMVRELAAALAQLVRFGSWTVAAHLVLVPITVGGFARKGESPWRDRTFRLHANVIAWVLAGAMALHPINFGSRFLLGIEPSLWAVDAWGLSGYWRGADQRRISPQRPQSTRRRRRRDKESDGGLAHRPQIPLVLIASGKDGRRSALRLLISRSRSLCLSLRGLCDLRGEMSSRRSVLGGPGMWLVGFGIGVLVADAPLAHGIPPGSFEGAASSELHLFRKLPQTIGIPAAVALVIAGLAAVVLRAALPAPPDRIARLASRAAIAGWTAVAFASMIPLILGPFALGPRWAFEVHMVAVGAILLLAWEHRHDALGLGALRFGLLATALIALFWLAGVPEPSVDPALALKLAVAALPALVAVPLARTTRMDGQAPDA
jgi:hypothetical protein